MKSPTMKTSLTINTKKIISIRTYIDEVDNDFVWKKEIRLFGLTIRKEGFYCCGNYVGKTIKTRNRYVVDKTVMFNPSVYIETDGYNHTIYFKNDILLNQFVHQTQTQKWINV